MNLGSNKNNDKFGASVKKNDSLSFNPRFKGRWEVKCFDKDGNLKWADEYENLVVNAGLDYALDAALSGGTQLTSWYVGIASGSPTPAAGDTMASHAGWNEFPSYDETVRQAWVDAGVSSQSATNSASTADFSINVNSSTIGGAFLVSDNSKTGSSGTLYAIGAFSGGNKAADAGDTLSVTATFTSADDGV